MFVRTISAQLSAPAYVYSIVNLHCSREASNTAQLDVHIGRAMAQEPREEPKRALPSSWIYACPCQAMPPIVIGSPLPFFGTQLGAGLGSILTLLLVEMLR